LSSVQATKHEALAVTGRGFVSVRDNILQKVDYGYNVRGWLTTLNEGALNGAENDLFAMRLNYQEDGINYNGNISGQSWLSHNVKTAPARRYAYTYDAANRLTGASYSGGKYSGENYSLSGMQYDKNGNILALSRSGMTAGTPTAPTAFGAVDGLSYTYQAGSNKLSTVSDAVSSNLAVGDFRDGNTTGSDYEYYADGSLRTDKNKGISTISYNYLGLVETVQTSGNGGSGTINFYYDATGRKWRKKVYNATSQQTALTDYDGEIVFETDPSQGKSHALSFIAHEEGHLIPDPQSGALVYEYHYKDHLGNLRVAFRQQRPQNTQASLSMEPQLAMKEEAAFENVAQNRVAGPAHSGNYAARLSQESGPGKTVKLQPGETLKASVFAHLEESGKKRTNWIPVPVIGDEPTMVDGKLRKKPVIRGGIALPVKFGKKQEELPEAYLQLIAKDSSGKVISLQSARVSKAAVGDWEELNLTYQAKEAQTVEVNLVNSSARTAVYFDDLQLTQEPPLIVQENHYDPWGLNLAGIETKGQPDHKFQYNGIEKEEAFGLSWAMAQFRAYDPQLGRFHRIDPIIKEHESPYAWNTNNPVSFADPDGADSTQRANAIAKAKEYVKKNPGDTYSWGGRAKPGGGVDCQGMVDNCIIAGGEKDPDSNGKDSGVKNIVAQSTEIEMKDAVPGNIVTLDNSKSGKDKPMGHVGIVVEIVRDKKGNVTGLKVVDSGGTAGSGKSGPRYTSINIGGKSYWDNRVTGVYKWDKIPDKKSSNTQATEPAPPPAIMQMIKEESGSGLGPALKDFFKSLIDW